MILDCVCLARLKRRLDIIRYILNNNSYTVIHIIYGYKSIKCYKWSSLSSLVRTASGVLIVLAESIIKGLWSTRVVPFRAVQLISTLKNMWQLWHGHYYKVRQVSWGSGHDSFHIGQILRTVLFGICQGRLWSDTNGSSIAHFSSIRPD